jgi:HSP20 family protein
MPWRRRYPFNWMLRDFDDMMNEIESRFSDMSGTRLLPPGGMADRLLPAIRGEFRVDVREHEDEVLIIADLPGVEKDDVSLNLINPRTLEISCERKAEKEEKAEGYFMRERVYGSMTRIVALPNDVTDEGATASFKNGVLEIRLKKITIERGARIQID